MDSWQLSITSVALVAALVLAGGCSDDAPVGADTDASLVVAADAGVSNNPLDGGRADARSASSADGGIEHDAAPPGPPGPLRAAWGRGVAGENAQWPAVAVAPDGALFVGGFFEGVVDVGGVVLASVDGGRDGFLIKYHPGGSVQWARSLGGSGNDAVTTIALDSAGNPTIAGDYTNAADFGGQVLIHDATSGGYVAKYDGATGALRWVSALGTDSRALPLDIAVTADGGAVVGGRFAGDLVTDVGTATSVDARDAFVVRIDATGTVEALFTAQGLGNDEVTSVVARPDGSIGALGYFETELDLGDGPISSAGDSDLFLVTLSPALVRTSSLVFGSAARDFAPHIGATTTGDYIFAGTSGGIDFGGGALPAGGFVARVQPDGTYVWSSALPATPDALVVGASDDYLVSGTFDGSIALGGGVLSGDEDLFVARFDGDRNHIWSHAFAADSLVRVVDAAINATSDVGLAGFGQDLEVDGAPITGGNVFLLSLVPNDVR